MAYYVSDRELRRIERERRNEDEERLQEVKTRQKEVHRAQQREQKEQQRKEKEKMETELREMREIINRVRQERQDIRKQTAYDRHTVEEANVRNELVRGVDARNRDGVSTSREKYTENERQGSRQNMVVNEGNRRGVRHEIIQGNIGEKTEILLEADRRQDEDMERIREEIDNTMEEDREGSEHRMKELERRKHETEKEIFKLQRSLKADRTPTGNFKPHESTRIGQDDGYEDVGSRREMSYDTERRMDNSLHKTMQWIDDKFDRMNDSREYGGSRHKEKRFTYEEDLYGYDRGNETENETNRIDNLKLRQQSFEEKMVKMRRDKEQKEIGYETDDEIERVTDMIEKMKLKQRMLEEEMNNRRKKKEQREQEYERRRKERKGKLDRLKQEEHRLRQRLRAYEDTLGEMNLSNSESDTELGQSHKNVTKVREEPKQLKLPKLPKLSEETFEEWKVEVEVMIESDIYSNEALLHAVRNAICNSSGNIRRILPTVSLSATTRDILNKLENIYGDRRSGESHLSEFYKSKQMSDESVAEWGVRLENILQKAANKGQIDEEQKNQMLKKRFWKYLHSERLKLNTRICFERCGSFEDLLKEVRVEERELNTDSDNSDLRSNEQSSAMNKLLERVEKLEENIKRTNIDDTERSYVGYGRTNEGWRVNFQRGRPRNRLRNDRRYEGNRRYFARNYSSDRYYRHEGGKTEYNRSSRDRQRDDSDDDRRRYRRFQDGDNGYRRYDDKRYQEGDNRYRRRDNSRERRDYDGDREARNSDRNWRDSRNESGSRRYNDDRGRQNVDRREHKERYNSKDRNTDKGQEHKERDRRNNEQDKQRNRYYQTGDEERDRRLRYNKDYANRDSRDGVRNQKVGSTEEPDRKNFGGRKNQSNR